VAVGIYMFCSSVNGGIAYFDDVSLKDVVPVRGALVDQSAFPGTCEVLATLEGAISDAPA
jgi:hypothetical protein